MDVPSTDLGVRRRACAQGKGRHGHGCKARDRDALGQRLPCRRLQGRGELPDDRAQRFPGGSDCHRRHRLRGMMWNVSGYGRLLSSQLTSPGAAGGGLRGACGRWWSSGWSGSLLMIGQAAASRSLRVQLTRDLMTIRLFRRRPPRIGAIPNIGRSGGDRFIDGRPGGRLSGGGKRLFRRRWVGLDQRTILRVQRAVRLWDGSGLAAEPAATPRCILG